MNVDRIVKLASEALFGHPLVTNVYRSVLVEAMVAEALPDWEWCSGDYASCDFRHQSGLRLEVKQSALKQSWETLKPSRPSWDIRPRTGYWNDAVEWVAQPGRNADIYVLAFHQVHDDSADHRDPAQWSFFVIKENTLPNIQRLGLASAQALASPVKIDALGPTVAQMQLQK